MGAAWLPHHNHTLSQSVFLCLAQSEHHLSTIAEHFLNFWVKLSTQIWALCEKSMDLSTLIWALFSNQVWYEHPNLSTIVKIALIWAVWSEHYSVIWLNLNGIVFLLKIKSVREVFAHASFVFHRFYGLLDGHFFHFLRGKNTVWVKLKLLLKLQVMIRMLILKVPSLICEVFNISNANSPNFITIKKPKKQRQSISFRAIVHHNVSKN